MKKHIYFLLLVVFFNCKENTDFAVPTQPIQQLIQKSFSVTSGIVKYTVLSTTNNNIQNNNTETLIFINYGSVKYNRIFSSKGTPVSSIKLTDTLKYVVNYPKKLITIHKIKEPITQEMIKVGNEIIKGYNCEIWKTSNSKRWIYKGVLLKHIQTNADSTYIKEATTADFNAIINESELELPNFDTIKLF